MEALVAVFSILYIFWPLIILFGFREFFSNSYSLGDRLLRGVAQIFIGWIVWAIFLVFIFWQGRRPILYLPGYLNYGLFGVLGVLTGGVTLFWMIYRWRKYRIRLSDNQKLEDLLALSPKDFEALVAVLFRAYGHQAQVCGGNSDHGVDVIVTSAMGEKWVVQCKRYSGSVGEPVVRDLFGTMLHEAAQRAYLMTTGSFTTQAQEWAAGKPLMLYDGDALVKLIQRTYKRTSDVFR